MSDLPLENLSLENAPAPAQAPRKKYVFTKRDPEKAAQLERERQAGMKNVRSAPRAKMALLGHLSFRLRLPSSNQHSADTGMMTCPSPPV